MRSGIDVFVLLICMAFCYAFASSPLSADAPAATCSITERWNVSYTGVAHLATHFSLYTPSECALLLGGNTTSSTGAGSMLSIDIAREGKINWLYYMAGRMKSEPPVMSDNDQLIFFIQPQSPQHCVLGATVTAQELLFPNTLWARGICGYIDDTTTGTLQFANVSGTGIVLFISTNDHQLNQSQTFSLTSFRASNGTLMSNTTLNVPTGYSTVISVVSANIVLMTMTQMNKVNMQQIYTLDSLGRATYVRTLPAALTSSLHVVILNQPTVYKNVSALTPQYIAVEPITGNVVWSINDAFLANSNLIRIHPDNSQQFIAAAWLDDPKSQNITLSFAIYDMTSGLQLSKDQTSVIAPALRNIQSNFSPTKFWFVLADYAYAFDLHSAEFLGDYIVPQPPTDVTIISGDDGSTLQYDIDGVHIVGQPGRKGGHSTTAAA